MDKYSFSINIRITVFTDKGETEARNKMWNSLRTMINGVNALRDMKRFIRLEDVLPVSEFKVADMFEHDEEAEEEAERLIDKLKEDNDIGDDILQGYV